MNQQTVARRPGFAGRVDLDILRELHEWLLGKAGEGNAYGVLFANMAGGTYSDSRERDLRYKARAAKSQAIKLGIYADVVRAAIEELEKQPWALPRSM